MTVSHTFSGHLNSNLFIRANRKISVTELWSSHVVPIVNQQFSTAHLERIRGPRTWDQCLTELLYLGAIYVDQKRRQEPFHVDSENVVRIHLMPRRFDTSVFCFDRDVIFQNQDFLIVNKPALLPVHPTLDNRVENLLFCLQQKTKGSVFGVHRLDLETTGLIVFSKTESATAHFQKIFSERDINKMYKAVVSGDGPSPGHYRHWMQKDSRSPKKISDFERPDHMLIELNVQGHGSFLPKTSVVEIELLTGKTHQIRSQLAHLGSPLMADSMYGGRPFADATLYPHFLLHACQLRFRDQQGHAHHFHSQPKWLEGQS